jgi:hypothetical protein
VDVAPADSVAELDKDLQEAGIELCFAELKDPVKDKLKWFGLIAEICESYFFPTIGAAVSSYLKSTRWTGRTEAYREIAVELTGSSMM